MEMRSQAPTGQRQRPRGGVTGHQHVGTPRPSVLTLRLDPELERDLDALAAATGRTRSEIVREALRRRVAVLRFEGARRG